LLGDLRRRGVEVGMARNEEAAIVERLSEFMAMLTQLGGYNNRATEAPPGPQPL
jgi:hypothetical protein